MAEASLQCIHDMSSHSVMWLQALKKIPGLWKIFKDCYRFFDEERPELVILIDYVGFNLYLAKYPFEETFYTNGGVSAKYVGHPLFDELNTREIDEVLVGKLKDGEDKTIVSLLPGSRKQEIRRLLPLLLKTSNIIHEKIPSVTFLLSCSNTRNLELIESITQSFTATNDKRLSIEIVTEKISEVIKASSLCISSSGTVVLEVANYHVPMVIFYRISPFPYFVAKPHMMRLQEQRLSRRNSCTGMTINGWLHTQPSYY